MYAIIKKDMPTKIKKEKRSFTSHHLTANYWAFATIIALPVVMFMASAIGVSSLGSFFAGMIGSLFVLCLNASLEQKLWMFTTHWKARFESHDFSFRLAIASGVIFLLMETALMFTFFTSAGLDRSLLRLVFNRQCHDPSGDFVEMCEALGSKYWQAEANASQE